MLSEILVLFSAEKVKIKSQSKIVLVLFLSIVISACGGGSGEHDRLVAPPVWVVRSLTTGTWVVMGSSTAAGAGASPGKSWVALLQADLAGHGVQFTNIAKGGAVTYQGLSATPDPVLDRPLPDAAANIDKALALDPVLLLVSYPSNDTAVGYSVEETVRNILAIRSSALADLVPVIVLSTQPRNLSPEKLAQLALVDEKLSAEIGPCFVNVHSSLADENGYLANQYSFDGVHPNDAGHLLIAVQVQSVLESGRCVILPGT